jgi:hypothetical protein
METMRDAGIPGIKYYDAGSRGAGEGTRNYVVFDDRLITILKKYGLGAGIAGGAVALTQGEFEAVADELRNAATQEAIGPDGRPVNVLRPGYAE